MDKDKVKEVSVLSGLIYGFLFAACAVVWCVLSFKAAILVFSLFQGLLWVNMVISAITSASCGSKPQNDAFWRIMLILMFSVGMGIYFSI